ncbi:hypothetical protein PI124_g20025 [Phytophthora idaei]|nr:hypothetical protein PI125_g21174 [Phytophthora idaei]KAG3139312.1 hypothetical protein PI126_g16513 [Phytophthora idaei]KAG3234930.1 hypothetical protein PI124_g20025 [Phytophthora idaei]
MTFRSSCSTPESPDRSRLSLLLLPLALPDGQDGTVSARTTGRRNDLQQERQHYPQNQAREIDPIA